MSISLFVFFESARLPNAKAWADAIRSSGFDLQLDTTFDLRTASGFRPCEHERTASGFEYYFGPSNECVETNSLDPAKIGVRDVCVQLVTHSDMRELMCATLAGAVLCSITEGAIWESEADHWVAAADALRWAHDMEAEIKPNL